MIVILYSHRAQHANTAHFYEQKNRTNLHSNVISLCPWQYHGIFQIQIEWRLFPKCITFVWHAGSPVFPTCSRKFGSSTRISFVLMGTTWSTPRVRLRRCYYSSWTCIDLCPRPGWIRVLQPLPLLLLLLYDGPYQDEQEYNFVCNLCFVYASVSYTMPVDVSRALSFWNGGVSDVLVDDRCC